MKLSEVLNGVSYKCGKFDDLEIKDIAYDSRKTGDGIMFVCLVGVNADGHKYALSAYEKGSRVFLCEKKVDLPEQDNTVEDYFEDLDNENYQQVYVRFITVVKIVKTRPERNRELQKRFFQEVRKLDRLIEQQNLLCDNDIESYEQLEQFSSSRKDELAELTKARDILRNKLKVAIRSGDEKEEDEIREHITNLSVMIKKLRRDIVICDRIEKQKPVIDERIEQAKESNSRKELMNYERIR